jgi:YggT family protein
MQHSSAALALLLNILLGLVMFVLLLRALLHATRADWHNPMTQVVLRLTRPVLAPLHRLMPPGQRVDGMSWLLLWVLALVRLLLDAVLLGKTLAHPFALLLASLAAVIDLVATFFFWTVLIEVVLSWVAPRHAHPGIRLISQLNAPLLRPLQRRLPTLGHFDLSPMILLLLLIIVPALLQGVLLDLAQFAN